MVGEAHHFQLACWCLKSVTPKSQAEGVTGSTLVPSPVPLTPWEVRRCCSALEWISIDSPKGLIPGGMTVSDVEEHLSQ